MLHTIEFVFFPRVSLFSVVTNLFLIPARKTDIIKMTECILDAINSGDFETYTYV